MISSSDCVLLSFQALSSFIQHLMQCVIVRIQAVQYCISLKIKFEGPSETGGQGGQLPHTFAENGAKIVKNRQISAEIWFLPPPHFWVLTPHFLVASEDPVKSNKKSIVGFH